MIRWTKDGRVARSWNEATGNYIVPGREEADRLADALDTCVAALRFYASDGTIAEKVLRDIGCESEKRD